jgi:Xaa-Pro aminopeptidase
MSPSTSPEAFETRRKRVAAALADRNLAAAVWTSGWARPRNFAHNVYPFRAESHFLYLTGQNLEGALLLFRQGEFSLYVTEQEPEAAIWEGRWETPEELGRRLNLPVHSIDELPAQPDAAVLPPQDDETALWIADLLERPCEAQSGAHLAEGDALLADGMIDVRLVHDEAAQAQLRYAAHATAHAHMQALRSASRSPTEAAVRGRFLFSLTASELGLAYEPIVTKGGEVLHARAGTARLEPGDLVLCDVGGETREGWAADITRTWPTSGRFSRPQRAIYQLVLNIQKAVINRIQPGVEYADLHDLAQRKMAEGLIDLQILKGTLNDVLEHHAQAIFFPHGVGHLLGLDVHDMEDLGDRAGYLAGRQRRDDLARRALRLDRPLQAGMAVTIEPGFYQIPQLIDHARHDPHLKGLIDFGELGHYQGVRGIRIEDDVLVTDGDADVLSRDVPKDLAPLEEALGEE